MNYFISIYFLFLMFLIVLTGEGGGNCMREFGDVVIKVIKNIIVEEQVTDLQE